MTTAPYTFEGKKVLVTGCAGSIGSQLLYELLSLSSPPTKVIGIDINESGLFELKQKYVDYSSLHLFTADICDLSDIRKYFSDVDMSLTSVIIALLTAVIIALFTWTKTGADSFLLPDYLKYQPFDHYWTVFISIGILLPLIPTIINAKSNDSVYETIDK